MENNLRYYELDKIILYVINKNIENYTFTLIFNFNHI